MTNYAEMLAGTNPIDGDSHLTLERVPRPQDLTLADQAGILPTQHALYFQSVPGKSYGVQWTEKLAGPWHTIAVLASTTTQTRLVYDRPEAQAFHRVILAQ